MKLNATARHFATTAISAVSAVLLSFAGLARGDPVASFPMNELSWSGPAPQVVDVTGNGHDGTAVGGASTVADPTFGQVGSFNGNGQYVTVGGSYAMQGARSIVAWVDPVANSPSGLPVLVGGTSGHGDFFGIVGSNKYEGAPQYSLYVDHWGTYLYRSTMVATPGQWNFVAITFDGASTVNFYVNGSPAGSTISNGLYNYDANTFTIGGNTIGGSTTVKSFDGTMRDLAIYNSELTASDILTIYNGTPTNPSSTWVGTSSTNWSDSGNWTGAVPGATTGTTNTDTAAFNQNAPLFPFTVDTGRNLKNLTFDTAAVNYLTVGAVDGPALLLTAGGTIQTTSTVVNPQTVNAPLVLEGDYAFTSGASSSSATLSFGGGITPGATSGVTTLTLSGGNTGANTISGVLADNGAGQLAVTKSGPSQWILSGANTYSGNTTVGSGTLRLAGGSANNIPNSPAISVASGATLDVTGLASSTLVLGSGNVAQALTGGGAVTGSVVVNGGLASGTGNAPSGSAITGGSGATLTISGGLKLRDGSVSNFNLASPNGSGNALTALVNVTGAAGLTVNGNHTVNLSGAAQVGTYELYAASTGTPLATQFSIGTNTAGNFGYAFTVIPNGEVDLDVIPPGGVAWDFNGGGTYSDNSKWNPAAVPNGAGLTAAFGNGVSNTVNITPHLTVLIDGSDVAGSLVLGNTYGTGYILGNDGVSGHGITLDNNGMGAAVNVSANTPQAILANLTLADNVAFTINTGSSLSITGNLNEVGGSRTLMMTGGGALVLGGANTYSGNTTVDGGTLRLAGGSINNIANSPIISVGNGATLDVTGLASSTLVLGSGNVAQALNGRGTVTGSVTVDGGIASGSGNAPTGSAIGGGSGSTLTIIGGLTLQDGSVSNFTLGAPNGSGNPLTAFVNVTGTAGLTVNGNHTVNLSGAAQVGTYELYAFTAGAPLATQFSIGTNTAGNFSYAFIVTPNAEVDLIVAGPFASADWDYRFMQGGNYSDNSKWNPATVPNGGGLTATFGNGISNTVNTSSMTVLVNGAEVAGSLVFNNTNNTGYILGSDGVSGHGITLNNNGLGAAVNVSANSPQSILANLTLADSVAFNISNTTSSLSITGNLSEAGGSQALTMTGPGTLTLGSANSYSGGTTINSGTLKTTHSGALGSGPLTINGTGVTSTVTLGASQTVSSLTSNGSGTGAAAINVVSGATLTSTGGLTTTGTLNLAGLGTTQIDGAPTLNANSKIQVTSQTLRFNVASGAATVGTGVTVTVGTRATLELAGSVSALSSVASRVNVTTSSFSTHGILVSGTHQQVGNVDGTGNVQVNAGSDLTANHIIQSALVIGGTAGNPGLVTIDVSDADGNPLSGGLSLTGSLASNGPFGAGIESTDLIDGRASDVAGSVGSGFTTGNSSGGAGHDAVPEPSTLALAGCGLAIAAVVGLRRRQRRLKTNHSSLTTVN